MINTRLQKLTLREEKLEEGVLAVEHEPGEVRLQRVPVLLQEALHVVRHRAGKMFDPAKKVQVRIVFPAVLWIQDPGSGDPWILDGKKSGSGIRDPGSGMIIADYIS
jgi:hypothetical protein